VGELGPSEKEGTRETVESFNKNSTIFKSFTHIETDLAESMTLLNKDEKILIEEIVSH